MMQFSTTEKREDILRLEKHSLNEELEAIKNLKYHAGRRTMLGDALGQVNKQVRGRFRFYLRFFTSNFNVFIRKDT